MSKFMFVFRGGPVMPQRLAPQELQLHLRKWSDWVGTLAREGHHVGGSPLENQGRTIHGASRTVFDGPQAGMKDVITGNVIVEAASLEAATELAKACPVFELNGSVEVWPLPNEAMAVRASAAE
ncbi:MAG: YciI family protein [Alphaproteobacteria bacterium]|nr:YciI family protein [Alphaproteobacteria bacterium]